MDTYEGYTATIEIDDDQLILKRKKTRLSGLDTEWTIPLAALSEIVVKDPSRLINGYLQVQIGDEPSGKPRLDDPQTVLFTYQQRTTLTGLAEHLRSIIADKRGAGTDPSSVPVERQQTRMDAKAMERQAKQATREAATAARVQAIQDKRADLKATHSEHKQALENKKAAVRAKRDSRPFKGIALTDDQIVSKDGTGPIAGAKAQVDAAGNIAFRSTLTRNLLLPGLSGLAFQKREDKREVYLVIEGNGFSIVKKVHASLESKQAREFAARINAAALAAESQANNAPAAPDHVALLSDLARLRDTGVLSESEFAAKKAEILDRI